MAVFDPGVEPLLDVFMYETLTLLNELEELLMTTEKAESVGSEEINSIFRIMHTIKGSSSMMGLADMSRLAHSVEDLFYILREKPDVSYDKSELYSHLFKAFDCLKNELETLADKDMPLTDFTDEINMIRQCAERIKSGENRSAAPAAVIHTTEVFGEGDIEATDIFAVHISFNGDESMPNMRAMVMLRGLKRLCEVLLTIPEEPTADEAAGLLSESGLVLKFKTDDSEAVIKKIKKSLGVKNVEIIEKPHKENTQTIHTVKKQSNPTDSIISVRLSKLDELLDLVSELVVAESMLTALPHLQTDEEFLKPVRTLKKLTDELQDFAMSVRMMPVSVAFGKMSRIVRDMNVSLGKNVELVFEGENTEVDKAVIDALGDPLMHLVRNAMDHGIETAEERIAAGKTEQPGITLSAQTSAGEVIIRVADNGKGMDAQKLIESAAKNAILTKPASEYTEAEALRLIMLPGFSTRETVTEYSGRGVGMDVVRQNVEKIRGTINIKSEYGKGTEFIIKIPLTLSVIDCMRTDVGKTSLLIPVLNIKEIFRAKAASLAKEENGRETVMLRNECYPVVRLHKALSVETEVTDLTQGIMILCDCDSGEVCLFADRLSDEVSVVIKSFPTLLNRMGVKDIGLTGCAILSDGSITLLADVKTLCERALKEEQA